MRDPKFAAAESIGSFVRSHPNPHCGRLDSHAAHEWISGPWEAVILDCPGQVTIEGGSLETHDCGARVHPAEIRECCSKCEGSLCPECEPCRRVS